MSRILCEIAMTSPAVDLAELDVPELETLLTERGLQPFHARQTYRWIHRRGITDPAAMTDLPLALRKTLDADFRISTPEVVRDETSVDGMRKLMLRLGDTRMIESVFIPDTPSMTFCVST